MKTDAYLHDKRPPKIRTKVKKNEFTALGSFGIVICLIFVNIYINCPTESGVQTCAPTNSPRLMALDGWYVKRWCAVGMLGRAWSFFSFHRSFVFMGGVVLFNLRSLACGLSFLSFILSGVENLFSASKVGRHFPKHTLVPGLCPCRSPVVMAVLFFLPFSRSDFCSFLDLLVPYLNLFMLHESYTNFYLFLCLFFLVFSYLFFLVSAFFLIVASFHRFVFSLALAYYYFYFLYVFVLRNFIGSLANLKKVF